VCERDSPDGDIRRETDSDTCAYCRTSKVSLSTLSGPVLVRHMSAHILHDIHLKDMESPCGFCLNTGTTCAHIVKSHPTADVELYKTHFEITQDENTLMKGVFQTVPRCTKMSRNDAALPTSDGTSVSSLFYLWTFQTHVCNLSDDVIGSTQGEINEGDGGC
jgi:hypothetical protein